MKDLRPKTIFCDIDGTILNHWGTAHYNMTAMVPKLLPGVKEKLGEWDARGYQIILITGRKEGMRRVTEQQLDGLGVIYDQLIMGIGGGIRVLVNDKKPGLDHDTAVAITVERNVGLDGVEV